MLTKTERKTMYVCETCHRTHSIERFAEDCERDCKAKATCEHLYHNYTTEMGYDMSGSFDIEKKCAKCGKYETFTVYEESLDGELAEYLFNKLN